MKKILTSIILICYLAVSSGIVINYHYCMNKLASTRLFEGEKKNCGKCGMHTKKSNGCCHDEVKVIKLSQDQTTAQGFIYELTAPGTISREFSGFIFTSFYNFEGQRHFLNHSPPLLSGLDTYIRNNVFRI